MLIAVSICIATGAGQWLMDPNTRVVPFSQSLTNHPFFILSTIMFRKYTYNDRQRTNAILFLANNWTFYFNCKMVKLNYSSNLDVEEN